MSYTYSNQEKDNGFNFEAIGWEVKKADDNTFVIVRSEKKNEVTFRIKGDKLIEKIDRGNKV